MDNNIIHKTQHVVRLTKAIDITLELDKII
jgi:hypothetical protein